MKISEHFGVYGVCIRNNQLLCVKKHGGPYNGRYDLPGGSRKNGESLLDTLYREMSEETSYQVSQIYDSALYDSFVKISEDEFNHHIFGLYKVELEKANHQAIEKYLNGNEDNDSLGEEWVELNELNEQNASPLILKVLAMSGDFQAKRYPDWEIY